MKATNVNSEHLLLLGCIRLDLGAEGLLILNYRLLQVGVVLACLQFVVVFRRESLNSVLIQLLLILNQLPAIAWF